MILVIDSSNGYVLSKDGQVLTVTDNEGRTVPAYLTDAEADQLRGKLADRLRPVSPRAVTPAKAMARAKPSIMRHPVRAAK